MTQTDNAKPLPCKLCGVGLVRQKMLTGFSAIILAHPNNECLLQDITFVEGSAHQDEWNALMSCERELESRIDVLLAAKNHQKATYEAAFALVRVHAENTVRLVRGTVFNQRKEIRKQAEILFEAITKAKKVLGDE